MRTLKRIDGVAILSNMGFVPSHIQNSCHFDFIRRFRSTWI